MANSKHLFRTGIYTIVVLLIPFGLIAQINVKYDRFKDRTIVYTGKIRLDESKAISLNLQTMNSGNRIIKPDSIDLTFIQELEHEGPSIVGNELIFLLDTLRHSFVSGLGVMSFAPYGKWSSISFTIPTNVFRQIYNDRRLDFRVAGIELRFDESARREISAFLRKFE